MDAPIPSAIVMAQVDRRDGHATRIQQLHPVRDSKNQCGGKPPAAGRIQGIARLRHTCKDFLKQYVSVLMDEHLRGRRRRR
jgi:hypothetical protein